MQELSVNKANPPRGPERVAARLAAKAYVDIYFGGAWALILLRRLERSEHWPLYERAVLDVYHHDTAPESTFWECPECGSPIFGKTNAAEHCFKVWA